MLVLVVTWSSSGRTERSFFSLLKLALASVGLELAMCVLLLVLMLRHINKSSEHSLINIFCTMHGAVNSFKFLSTKDSAPSAAEKSRPFAAPSPRQDP